jgi:hypothetical protein
MSENRESTELAIHASAPNSAILLDHCQQLKETADLQLWLWITSPNG